jgi:glycosyltransferase involved in cell wall biosynthesis
MQETSFEFEILIHDDASTDGTINIIKEYQKKYPHLIKPIIQKENQYSKGQRGMNPKFNFPRAQGKYIALCEGDDYWTDPYKLQKQIDFLENNPNYVACFTNAEIINEISEVERKYLECEENKSYSIEDILKKGGGVFPTASLVFRNTRKEWPDFMFKHKSGDRALSLILAELGDFYLFNEITCAYRRHEGGIFSSIKNDLGKRNIITMDNVKLLEEFNLTYHNKYNDAVKKAISRLILTLFVRDKSLLLKKYTLVYLRMMKVKDILRLIKNFII